MEGNRLRRGLLAAAATLCTAVVVAAPARAAAPPDDQTFTKGCAPYPGNERVCSAQVTSFDGAPLDADLTEPINSGPGQKHPLIVLIHGFGNNKHEWESTTDAGDGADKFRWNSHWFAAHGYYVLTATARGFRDDGTDRPDQPDTPSGTSLGGNNGTIHLKSREFEIRDTQWLAALAAASHPDIDRSQIAVSGGSYGGGESWLQASQAEWTFAHDCTAPGATGTLAEQCQANHSGPQLPALSLQVAVPKYPWTDLAYSLAPHGRPGGPGHDDIYESSQADENNDTGLGQNPFGVIKQSFVGGFYGLGTAGGAFEDGTTAPTYEEGPINITAWNTRAAAGEPYDVSGQGTDPVIDQLARGLTEFRSAYYQNGGWDQEAKNREVAVYSIQGWTDDLFEAIESFRMFKALKRRDPQWPVAVGLGDVGHARAQNRPATWQRLNDQAWSFLQSNIGGSHRQQTTVSSEPTTCNGDPTANAPSARVTGSTPESLSAGTLRIDYARGDTLTQSSGTGDPDAVASDPVTGDVIAPNDGCVQSKAETFPGRYTAVSAPLPNERTYVGLGYVRVGYTYAGNAGQLDARVWDVAPDGGKTLLVTRGVRRIDPTFEPATGTLRLPLYGNHWRLAPGHRIRLDLVESDAPYLRPSNPANTLTFTSPTLVLPTREAAGGTLGGN